MMLEELYEVYWRELVGYCRGSMTYNLDAAEDLAQETFTRALTNFGTLQELTPAQRRAWLYTTARRIYIDQQRRARTARRYEMPDEGYAQDDLSAAGVMQAIDTLPQQQRSIVMMRYFNGFNGNEIARRLGIPAGTVRSQLSRAAVKLRRQWLIEDE